MNKQTYLFIGNHVLVEHLIYLFKEFEIQRILKFKPGVTEINSTVTHIIYFDDTNLNPNNLSEMIKNLYSIPIYLAKYTNLNNIHFTIFSNYCDAKSVENVRNTINNKLNAKLKIFNNILNLKLYKLITYEYNSNNYLYNILNNKYKSKTKSSYSIIEDILDISKKLIIDKHCDEITLVNPGPLSDYQIWNKYNKFVNKDNKDNKDNSISNPPTLYSTRDHRILNSYKITDIFPNIKNTDKALKDIFDIIRLNIV